MDIENTAMITGYGLTGRSVEAFLDERGVKVPFCDDGEMAGVASCLDVDYGALDFVVKSPGMPRSEAMADVGAVINDVEMFLRYTFKPVIFVTGTNGKSTVTKLIQDILCANDIRACACGNYGKPVLDVLDQDIDVYVIEASSFQIEDLVSQSSLSSIVLNVAPDHMDRYDSLEQYRQTKTKVYDGALSPVYPVDSEGRVAYGGEQTGFVSGQDRRGARAEIVDGAICLNGEAVVGLKDLALLGRHNHLNVCAALCVCSIFALDMKRTAETIKGFRGLPHRMEPVAAPAAGPIWVNDSKSTNLHALEAAIASLDGTICLIAGGYGKGEGYAETFNRLSGHIAHLITFGAEAGAMYQQAGCVSSRRQVGALDEAVRVAHELCGDVDYVLLSPGCASYDLYNNYQERGAHYAALVKSIYGDRDD